MENFSMHEPIRVEPLIPDNSDHRGPEAGDRAAKKKKKKRRHRSRREDSEERDAPVRQGADNAAFDAGQQGWAPAGQEAGNSAPVQQGGESYEIDFPGARPAAAAKAAGSAVHSPQPTTRSALRSTRNQLPLHEFVQQNIRMRECAQYVTNTSDRTVCHCNRSAEWHRARGMAVAEDSDQKWTVEQCSVTKPSEFFGRMKLQGFGRTRSSHKPLFIRIDSETRNFEALWELMTSKRYWNLPLPDLVLSVSGGAKKMEKMSAKLEKKVKMGLIDVSTGVRTTWIITPGFNLGCSQMVGRAVQEYIFAGGSERICIIGVCTWGAVYNRDCLQAAQADKGGMGVCEYANSVENPGRGQAVVEPNHTHFIFCDDGTEKYFGKEIEFRAEFEQFIVNKLKSLVSGPDEFNPPVVQVVIEGGKKAVLTAGSCARAGTPVIAVQGSGRAANELAYFRNVRSLHRNVDDAVVERKLAEMIEKYKPTWRTNPKEEAQIKEILMKFSKENPQDEFDCNLLSVFNPDSDEDLAKTILYTFFKHRDYKNSTMTQVRLCMAWNRADVAAAEIFSESKKSKWKGMNLQRAMKEALVKQQKDFVELFLDHGIDLSKFLTFETLSELYEKMFTSRSSQATRLLHKLDKNHCCTRGVSSVSVLRAATEKNNDELVLTAVNNLIKIYTEYAVDGLYAEENLRDDLSHGASPLSKPLQQERIFPPYTKAGRRRFTSQDLFLWSVLNHNVDLAFLFWKHGKDQIGTALVGYSVLKNMAMDAESSGEMETKEMMEKDAESFERLAVGVLEVCNNRRKELCRLLLVRNLPYWSNQTVMAIAEANQCMDLLYQTPVQTVLTETWMGGMEADTSNWRIVLCLFAPFLVQALIFHSHELEPTAAVQNDDAVVEGQDMNSTMREVEEVNVDGPNVREALEDLQVEDAISDLSNRTKRSMRLLKLRHQQRGFRNLRLWTALILFYSAPISKFILNMISTAIFLLLFSYVVLVQLHPMEQSCPLNSTHSTHIPAAVAPYIGFPQPHGVEIFLFVWAFAYVLEEFRQFFSKQQPLVKKVRELSYWDKFDIIICLLFIVCLVLRLTVSCSSFDWVRNVYAVTLAFCFIRFMQFYYPSPTLGPKVVMIINMLSDVVFFVMILVVFILAYGVAAYSLLRDTSYDYVNKKFEFATLLRGIFYLPYWQMYGELNLEEIFQSSASDSVRNWLVIGMFGIYMLATNVLLLNLLIAMFGHTFEKVQSESHKYYAYIRHDLIYEYYKRPILPPPFLVLVLAWRLLKYIRFHCCCRGCPGRRGRKYDDFCMELGQNEHQRMSAFELQAADKFLREHESEADDDSSRKQSGLPGAALAGGEEFADVFKDGDARKIVADLEEKCTRMEQQLKSVTESNAKILQTLQHLSSSRVAPGQ